MAREAARDEPLDRAARLGRLARGELVLDDEVQRRVDARLRHRRVRPREGVVVRLDGPEPLLLHCVLPGARFGRAIGVVVHARRGP